MNTASGKTIEQQIELLWDVLHEYQDHLADCESNERRWASICEAMAQICEATAQITESREWDDFWENK